MNKLSAIIVAVFAVIGIATAMSPVSVGASAKSQIQGGLNSVNDGNSADLEGSVTNIVNIMLYIIGILAVVLIIFGGIRYTISGGDSSKVKAAKDTIMYAVIGLVVALLAFAIINFVLDEL